VREGPVWPAPYDQETEETAFRWLTECWWTLDEAARRTELVPQKEFIRRFVHEWFTCFSSRQPMVVEKSRRMVISWAARGLETWVCGLKRSEWLIVDQTHTNAAEHLWRCHFSLEQLRQRRPELKIPQHVTRGAVIAKEPTHVILPNGSILTQVHQDAGTSQGKGKTGITLEEVSRYHSPTAFWNQAVLVTQGPPGELGGWLCGIANAHPDPDWRAIKANNSARKMLGLE
jgi:hypothetical protein